MKKSILNKEEEVMLDPIWWLYGDLVELALSRWSDKKSFIKSIQSIPD